MGLGIPKVSALLCRIIICRFAMGEKEDGGIETVIISGKGPGKAHISPFAEGRGGWPLLQPGFRTLAGTPLASRALRRQLGQMGRDAGTGAAVR